MQKLQQKNNRRPIRRIALNRETVKVLGTGPVATTTPDPTNIETAVCDYSTGGGCP